MFLAYGSAFNLPNGPIAAVLAVSLPSGHDTRLSAVEGCKRLHCNQIALEVSAEKFNNHLYLVKAEGDAPAFNLFAFPASYIAHLARSMDVEVDPDAGIVIGKVNGPSLRIDALADQALVNNAKDFYFDAKGRLRGSHEMTDPRFGTYIIFNVPKGRALLQGNDSAGVLRYSDAIYASPSSVNVEME